MAPRPSTSQGSVEPRRASIKGENSEVFGKNADCDRTARFLPARANLEQRTGKIFGTLSERTRGSGRADAGSGADFTAHGGLGITVFLFLHGVTFEKRGFGSSN